MASYYLELFVKAVYGKGSKIDVICANPQQLTYVSKQKIIYFQPVHSNIYGGKLRL